MRPPEILGIGHERRASLGCAEVGDDVGVVQVDPDDAVTAPLEQGPGGQPDARGCAGDEVGARHVDLLGQTAGSALSTLAPFGAGDATKVGSRTSRARAGRPIVGSMVR